jgi:hypothetical protein
MTEELERIRAFVEELDQEITFSGDVSDDYRRGYNHARHDLAGVVDTLLTELASRNHRDVVAEARR